jgi:peptide/nickel transport system substrate-binding protein
VTLSRNPRYREPGRPYLDGVVFKFVPSKDAEIQALAAGDIDAAYFLDPTYLPQLATMADVAADPAPGGIQEVVVNLSCPSGPQQGDPACPHPIATEAMQLRTRYAFEELGLEKLITNVDEDNPASRRALERVGYRTVGLHRRHRFRGGV